MNNANKVLLLAGAGFLVLSFAIIAFILLRPAPVVPQSVPRPLPVEITFRKAASGDGMVAKIKNTSSQTIALAIKLVKSPSGQQKVFKFGLKAGKIEELGAAQGYAAAPGDSLEMVSPGYDKMQLTVQ